MVDPQVQFMHFRAQALEIYQSPPTVDRSMGAGLASLELAAFNYQLLEIKYTLVTFQKWVSDSTASYSYWRDVSMVSALSKSSSAWILAAHKDDKAVSIDGFVAAAMLELVVARFLFAKSTWTENSE